MSKLPTEIWLLIASHITESQLKSVNSFFLDCYMNTTWKYLMITTNSPFRAVRRLLRMVYVHSNYLLDWG